MTQLLDDLRALDMRRLERYRWFHNALRILFNIDAYQFPGDAEDWPAFRDDPHGYFIRANDDVSGKLYALIEARKPFPETAWRPIATAPKSTTRPVPGGHDVRGAYFLGYCPDESATDPQSCICVCWWEPHMHGLDKGGWQGEGDYELRPIAWMPLPDARAIATEEGKVSP